MAEKLPDEIVSEILTLFLKVPEELFSETRSGSSPFVSFSESSSAALVVCKTWLRCATPLLYKAVILRSKAQAQALAAALRKNAELGKFIKMLRVEGGFGSSMGTILKSAPNITDIVISLIIRSADNTSGLAAGLNSINPIRLIISDEVADFPRNKPLTQLAASIEVSAQQWSNLRTIVFPYYRLNNISRRNLMLALCRLAPSVSFPHYGSSFPAYLPEIAQIPTIENVEMRIPVGHSVEPAFEVSLALHPRLQSVLTWANNRASVPAQDACDLRPTNPTFSPMKSAPQLVVDKIWTRVLFFVNLHVQETCNRNLVNRGRLHLLLVSSAFKRLALPFLYATPNFTDVGSLQKFSHRISADSSLSTHVREINIHFHRWTTANLENASILSLFSSLPRLTKFIGAGPHTVSITWEALQVLAATAGPFLVELSGIFIYSDEERRSPGVFRQFPVLRSLKWSSNVLFSTEGILPTALSALEVLEVGYRLLPVLSAMELPNLRSVALDYSCSSDYGPFLVAHGAKIQDLTVNCPTRRTHSIFALCPYMTTLTVDFRSSEDCYAFSNLSYPPGHASLRKLVIHKAVHRAHAKEEKEWAVVTSSLDVDHFPSLREVQLATVTWPDFRTGIYSDFLLLPRHAIAQCCWIDWAEGLLKRAIKVMDKTGTAWRARLKGR
ncbi:hypothetical protein C8J57DRAFT_675801 [Mycena rebaudengoi]|nr:hypothetical protein C8J57DRAFT_675801 [Mycena rebaudengoi]